MNKQVLKNRRDKGVPDSLRLISKTARMQIEAPKPQKNGLGMREFIMITKARKL